jgi:hypothetical protein
LSAHPAFPLTLLARPPHLFAHPSSPPQDYIARVGSEFSRALQAAATGGGLAEARAFASAHRGLVVSTILPLAIIARYPAAGIAALRIIGPAFIIASRILPVQVCI